MKKFFLMLALIPLFVCGCSSDEEKEDLIEVSIFELKGSWATDADDNSRKYLDFDEDGSGYFALLHKTDIILDYTFKFKISGDEIYVSDTYPHDLGSYSLKYSYSTNNLKIKEGDEKGNYKRLK